MTVRQFLEVVEIRTKVISLSTYALGSLYVAWTGHQVHVLPAVLLAVSVLCVDMGTTAFDSFFDYMRGVDDRRHNRERDKVLVHQGVAPGMALIISIVLYLVAAVTGLIVASLSTRWIVLAGAIGLLIGFLYTGGPLPISRTPFGELFAGGALGSLLFLVVFLVHTRSLTWSVVTASVPSMLIIASVLTVNNTCDIEGDRAAGRHTLSIIVGRAAGEALVYLMGTLGYGLLTLMSVAGRMEELGRPWPIRFPSLPGAGVFAAPAGLLVTVLIYIRMHRAGYSHETKHRNMGAVMCVVLVFTVTVAAILITGIAMQWT